MKTTLLLIFALCLSFLTLNNTYAGGQSGLFIPSTDQGASQLVGVFDLRDREAFIQITNIDSDQQVIHIKTFDVNNNCNENNFFDTYTPNDTHVYDLRNIQTNDGNPSGVILPDNAYGVFVAEVINIDFDEDEIIIGNSRIADNNGYEYRTNLVDFGVFNPEADDEIITFNYNIKGDISLSDIIGISVDGTDNFEPNGGIEVSNVLDIWTAFDVDIYDLNEVPFSCRNVIFSCINQDNPLLEALLEDSGDASVANIEYGINDVIPHSKGGELLCPGNIISEGFVRLEKIGQGDETNGEFVIFVGLNNGNGRGSMDTAWNDSCIIDNNCES